MMNFNSMQLVFYAMIGLFTFITCNPTMQMSTPSDNQVISLSLINEGVNQANYTGTDINAIMHFDDSVVCDFNKIISFHSIRAQFYIPDEALLNTKIKTLSLPMYWIEKNTLPYDSVSKNRYDSIFVKVGLKKSNTVKVYIVNLPPIIDSLIVGDSSFYVSNRKKTLNVFSYFIKTKMEKDLPLRVVAKDLDNASVRLTWENTGDDKFLTWNVLQNPQKASYKQSGSYFTDIVSVIAFDTDASAQVTVKLICQNFTLSLDSVRIDKQFSAQVSNKVLPFYFVTCDTFAAQISSSSPNIRGKWSTKTGYLLKDTILGDTILKTFRTTYTNQRVSLHDTLKIDTLLFFDTLTFCLKNHFNDSIMFKAVLVQKPANTKPIIDSIIIDTSVFRPIAINSVLPLSYLIKKPLPIAIIIGAHDTDKPVQQLMYQWKPISVLKGALNQTIGPKVIYTPIVSFYYDTLEVTVLDTIGFLCRKKIVLSTNAQPEIDSVRINDTLFVRKSLVDTQFVATKNGGVSFSIIRYVHDLNTSMGDKLKTNWIYRNATLGKVTTASDTLLYKSALATYSDTVILIVNDSLKTYDKQNIILNFKKP